MINTYEDMIATDVERIQRAKATLRDRHARVMEKREAKAMLELYVELSNEFLVRGTEDEQDRAREIMYELNKKDVHEL